MEKHDVIVVGAGPAGLVASTTMAAAGLDVVLLDRKTSLMSISRSCGACFITDPRCNDETISFKGDRIIFHKNDFSVRYSGLWKDLRGFHLVSPGGFRVRVKRQETMVSRAFNKQVLLEDLLTEAERAGVHIKTNSNVVGASNEVNSAVITVR